MKKLLTILFLICFSVANSTTVYISNSGTNSGAGGVGAPWLTLAYAVAHTSSGDIIHVLPGTFLQTAKIQLPVGVSIEGDGNTSIITSNYAVAFDPTLELASVEGTNGNQHISNIKMDGLLTGDFAIWVKGRSNVSIYNCTIVDFFNQGVTWSGRNDGNNGAPSIYATGNSFHDNTVSNCAQYNGFGRGCVNFGGQTGMLCYNDTISQYQRSPVQNNGWPIKYANDGYCKGLKIYNCILTKNLHQGGDNWSFALEIFNSQGTEVYNNTIQGSLDFNFNGDRGTYPWAISVHDNVISIPSYSNYIQEGLILEYSVDGLQVYNNTFDHLFNLASFYPRANALIRDVVIRNNLCTNLGSAAATAYFIGGFDAPNVAVRNMQIFNNTITNDTTPNHNGNWAFQLTGSGTYVWDSIFIKNNIIKGFSNTAGYIEDITKFTHCVWQYNDVNGWDEFNNQDNVHWTPTWSTGYTGYPGTITINNNLNGVQPGFVGGSPYSYHLQSTSPMIDAGIDVGLPFYNSAPDIGYWEYGSNIYPTANAGADQSITLPTTSVTMAGSGTDADGTIVSKAWTQVSGATATITTPSSYTTTITGLTAGTYVFRLTVTDNSGATGSDDMTVTVSAGDVTAPTVSSVTPANGSTGVALAIHPTATFSEALASGTVNTTNVTLTQGVTNIPITVGLSTNVITITPNSALDSNKVYTVTLKTGIQDLAGNALATQYTYSFTTVAGGGGTIIRQYFVIPRGTVFQ